MSGDQIARIAEGLAADWWDRAPYRAVEFGDMEEAYAVQRALHPLLAERRGPIAGRKIALSSKAMQEMVNISQPVAGAFFANDLLNSPADVELATFRHMGVEAELAFRLSQHVTVSTELEDLTPLISEVRPAFELVEDKDVDYAAIDALTLVADNAWCGAVVLGTPIKDWQALDLADLAGTLSQTGQPDEATNTGAANPVGSLRWLINHVLVQGQTLAAGEVLITGSAVRTRFPAKGETLIYDITGHASVSLTLT
ncbi:MAG: fumarylacetoacetate hydrolase family protein [Pseudomonadota bacterium]